MTQSRWTTITFPRILFTGTSPNVRGGNIPFSPSTFPSKSETIECFINGIYGEQFSTQNIVILMKSRLAIFLCAGSYNVTSASCVSRHLNGL